MAIKLSNKDKVNAISWMYDLFLGGKLISNKSKRFYMTFAGDYTNKSSIAAICNEILNRQFADLDAAFETLSYSKFTSTMTSSRKACQRSAETLASYVAWWCSENGIYWDNSLKTTYEMEVFEKTLLGAALKLYNCFTVVDGNQTTNTATQNQTKVQTTKVPGQPPKNNYKSTGGQSGKVRDLKGTAGNKEFLSGWVFRIEGVNTAAKKIPYAFIRPLKDSGAKNGTNNVFVGDPSGYTDCTLFFSDLAEADAFLLKCNQGGVVGSTITNLHVSKIKADSNGYYKVGTIFGDAYIKASKLNEEVEDKDNLEESNTFKIDDIKEFHKNLMKE